MRANESLGTRNMHLPCKVRFNARVLDYILFETSKYPNAEEGGKYIGKIEQGGIMGTQSLLISDFLPGGPHAKRTSVEFFPDGEYQEKMFRAIERADPDIEHLGSWHTHHCNGLKQLSSGDIDGYFRTVNKDAYRPTVFLASLVKFIPCAVDVKGWISHYLFVRGDDDFYDVTDQIDIVDSDQNYERWTGHGTQIVADGVVRSWFDSEVGRLTLSEDRKCFASAFSKAVWTRKAGQIRTRCEKAGGFMSVTYPSRQSDVQLFVDIKTRTGAVLVIQCDLQSRAAAFAAAVAALEYQ